MSIKTTGIVVTSIGVVLPEIDHYTICDRNGSEPSSSHAVCVTFVLYYFSHARGFT